MRVKTQIIALVGFVTLATLGSAATTETSAQPLKQRILSQNLGNQGSSKHVASQVSSSTAQQSGIMKGGKTLAQQEEAKTEESKVEAKVEEAPATTTTEAPAPLAAEASKTDTQNVESIRGNLGSYQNQGLNPSGVGYQPGQIVGTNKGEPVMSFGNRVGGDNDYRLNDNNLRVDSRLRATDNNFRRNFSRNSSKSSCSRSRSRSFSPFQGDYNLGLGVNRLRRAQPRYGQRDREDRYDDRGLGVGRIRSGRGGCQTCGNLDDPSVGRVGAPSIPGANQLGGTTIPSADVQMESNRALGFHLQPDVQLNRAEESAMVSNEETHRQGCTSGSKYRHFNIKGDIVVSEKVTFAENSVEEEKTAGCAAKNTVAVETTDVGDVLSGDQQVYTVETRQPLEYTLGRGDRDDCNDNRGLNLGGTRLGDMGDSCGSYLRNPFPENCYSDRQCQEIDEHYVCSSRDQCDTDQHFRNRSNRVCVPIRGNECSRKNGKYCEIEGVAGKCSDRNYCVPLQCRTDDECLHDDLYFCKRSRKLVKNGRKGQCYLKSEL